MDTPELKNRRQRIDEARHALDQAFAGQAAAEAREMGTAADAEISRQKTIEATKRVDAARNGLAEALAYQDPAATSLPQAAPASNGSADELFEEQPGAV